MSLLNFESVSPLTSLLLTKMIDSISQENLVSLLYKIQLTVEKNDLSEIDFFFGQLEKINSTLENKPIFKQYAKNYLRENDLFKNYFALKSAFHFKFYQETEINQRLLVFWIGCSSERIKKTGSSYFKKLSTEKKDKYFSVIENVIPLITENDKYQVGAVMFSFLLLENKSIKVLSKDYKNLILSTIEKFITTRNIRSIEMLFKSIGFYIFAFARLYFKFEDEMMLPTLFKKDINQWIVFLKNGRRSVFQIEKMSDKLYLLEKINPSKKYLFILFFLENLLVSFLFQNMKGNLDLESIKVTILKLFEHQELSNNKITTKKILNIFKIIFLINSKSTTIFKNPFGWKIWQMSLRDIEDDPMVLTNFISTYPDFYHDLKHSSTNSLFSKYVIIFNKQNLKIENAEHLFEYFQIMKKEIKRFRNECKNQLNFRSELFLELYFQLISIIIKCLHYKMNTEYQLNKIYSNFQMINKNEPQLVFQISVWKLAKLIFIVHHKLHSDFNLRLIQMIEKDYFLIFFDQLFCN